MNSTLSAKVDSIRVRPDSEIRFRSLTKARRWFEDNTNPFLMQRASNLMDVLISLNADAPLGLMFGTKPQLCWGYTAEGANMISDLWIEDRGYVGAIALQIQAGVPIYERMGFFSESAEALRSTLAGIARIDGPFPMKTPDGVQGTGITHTLIVTPFSAAPTAAEVRAKQDRARQEGREEFGIGTIALPDPLAVDSALFTKGALRPPREWLN